MAVSNTPVFVQTPRIGTVTLSTGTGTAFTSVLTAGSNGTKVTSVIAVSGSSIAQLTFLAISSGGGSPPILGTVSVPINAGVDGSTPGVDLLGGGANSLIVGLPVDNDGQKYIFLPSGYSIQMSLAVTLPAGRSFYGISVGADF